MTTLFDAMERLLPFSLFQYDFMKLALLAMLLITPLFGLLGTMAVDNRMAFFSDALGHSALTGVAIGVVLGVQDPTVSMIVFGLAFALLLTRINQRSGAATDTIISVFSSTAIAVGLVVLSRGGGFAKYTNFLVGDILAVTPGDLLVLAVVLALVTLLWGRLFNPLLMGSVNPSLAASRGIPAKAAQYAFVAVVAVVVMLSIRWVGVLLINSLLILPAATARNLSRNMAAYARWSVGISLVCGVSGLVLSYTWNTSAGATVVVLAAGCYFLSLLFQKRFTD